MTGHPLGSHALRRGLGAAHIATVLSIVALVNVAPVIDQTTSSAPPIAAGVERVVAPERPTARTGLPTLTINRPPAPVGDVGAAIDTDAIVALAGPVASPNPSEDSTQWFLVGDSTFTAAARHVGGGSAFPGVGFELAPFVGAPNPLVSPPPDFDGIVVIGVSIWDAPTTDADAYVAAVSHYRSHGHPVLVVEVPERFGPGDQVVTTEVETRAFRALNRRVADALACELAPWTVRDVETTGDVDGGDDHVHPTATGVLQLIENLEAAIDLVCRAERPAELR